MTIPEAGMGAGEVLRLPGRSEDHASAHPHDFVTQYADSLNFKLYHVPRLEKSAHLKPTAAPLCPGTGT